MEEKKPGSSEEKLLSEIRDAFTETNLALARSLVAKYLKRFGKSSEHRSRIADLLLVHQQPEEALRAISLESLFSRSPDRRPAREAVITARVLNALGASSYALQLLKLLPPDPEPSLHREIAAVYATNRLYEDSLRHLTAYAEHADLLADPYGGGVLVQSARAWAELGRIDRAEECLERIFSADPAEPSVAAARLLQGYVRIKSGQIAAALAPLSQAAEFYRSRNLHTNARYAWMWLGAVFAFEGKFAEAASHLDEAWRFFHQPNVTPEIWTEALYWRGFLAHRRTDRCPEEWMRLCLYPGSWSGSLSPYGWRKEIEKRTRLPDAYVFQAPERTSAENERGIRFDSPEFERLGLPERPRALAQALVLAGNLGVPVPRILEVLWPDEARSFMQLRPRLNQILTRMGGRHGFEFRRDGLSLFLGAPELRLEWPADTASAEDRFLANRARFVRSEVEKHFSLSTSAAALLCRQWLDSGKIESHGAGRSRSYVPKKPDPSSA